MTKLIYLFLIFSSVAFAQKDSCEAPVSQPKSLRKLCQRINEEKQRLTAEQRRLAPGCIFKDTGDWFCPAHIRQAIPKELINLQPTCIINDSAQIEFCPHKIRRPIPPELINPHPKLLFRDVVGLRWHIDPLSTTEEGQIVVRAGGR